MALGIGANSAIFSAVNTVLRAVAGIAASFGPTRLLSTFLFGVKPWDPVMFVSAPLILTAIALLAVWLPPWRASKVDPMQALRTE